MTPSRIARYEIQRRLSSGGMGSLYLARDPGLERLVAIKLLKAEFQDDADLRERFTREARSVARLRHPNIIIVFEIGEDDGRPFIAMEYIAGETLDAFLRRQPSVSMVRRLSLMEDLCAGVAHAHGAGIIHRDIKPANVMLDADGVLKVLDFGIARFGNSGMTQDGAMMGTVNYMSPEQVKGRGVDHRTDIFAVGAVIYESVALEQAFPGRIDSGVLQRILVDGPVPLPERVPGVDPELAAIVQHALQRDPARRYQDVNVLRRDLARVRRRLMEQEPMSGVQPDNSAGTTILPRPPTSSADRKDSDRPRRLHPERIVELQRQQVEEYLRFGQEAFERDEHDVALHYAERAATVDPDSRSAFDLIDRSRFAIGAKAMRRVLAEAQRLLAQGQLDDASALAGEASVTLPEVDGAEELREDVRRTVEQITAAQDRERRITDSLERARSAIERGGLDTALRAVYEVLALDPERSEARALELQAQSRLQAQREHERARQQAYAQLKDARELSAGGRHDAAIAAIAAITPVSDTVRIAAVEALAEARKAKRLEANAVVVAGAQAAFADGRLEDALSALDAIPLAERLDEVGRFRATVENALVERRELQRKNRAVDELLASADAFLDADQLAGARDRLEEASKIGLEDARIPALRQRIETLEAAAENRRRQEAQDRRAAQRVEAARQLLVGGDAAAAISLLERDDTGHPLVQQAIKETRVAIAAQEERVKREAERRQQQEEIRRRAELDAARARDEQQRAEEQKRRDETVSRIIAKAATTESHEIALNLLNEALKIAPDDPRVGSLIQQRTVELARQLDAEQQEARDRAQAERLEREAAERRATLEAERRRADEHREAERLRLEEEARNEALRRHAEEVAQEQEAALTVLLTMVRHTEAHDAALTLLSGAPADDPRVQTLLHERTAALESERQAARAAEAAAARERERIADDERQAHVMDVIAHARQLFEAGQPTEALTLLRQASPHSLIQAVQTELAARIAEADRLRQRADRVRARAQRSETAAAIARRVVSDGRVRSAAAVILVGVLAWGVWQLLPASRPDEQTGVATGALPSADPGVGSTSPQPVDTPSAALPRAETPRGSAPPDVMGPGPQPPRPRDSAAVPEGDRPPAGNPQRPPVAGPATGPAPESPVAGPISPATPAPPTVPPQQQPAPSVTERATTTPPEDRSPVPAAASVNPEQDRADIQALLNDYVAAYSRLDDAQLKSIDPGFEGIRQRALIKSVELRLQASIRVAADGQSAVLNATGTFNYAWNRERMPPTTPAQLTWNLRKVNGRWMVAR